MRLVRHGRFLPQVQHLLVVEIQMPPGELVEDPLRLAVELEEGKKERQVWFGLGIRPFPQQSKRRRVVTVRKELRPIDRRLANGIELNQLRETLREPEEIVRGALIHVGKMDA